MSDRAHAAPKAAPAGRVAVVVLGDLGRSPRMLAHALSLAQAGQQVSLVGYTESALPEDLTAHANVTVVAVADRLGEALQFATGPVRLMLAALRACALALELCVTLFTMARPNTVLVQNPPAVPTLAVAYLAARLRRARLVIDWHNIGHDMVAARLGRRGLASALVALQERMLGRRADAHLAVSQALKDRLGAEWGIVASLLPDLPRWDRPPTPLPARHALLECVTGTRIRADQVVVVSSTSWSFDEDFDLLLDALARYDAAAAAPEARYSQLRLPSLLVIVSGRGPNRAAFEARVAALTLQNVVVRTTWVSAADYPLLLAAADLGLCLHRSASGCDLPMKVIDMLASSLPVLAYDYGPCLREQLNPGKNSFFFDSAESLANRLIDTLSGFPEDVAVLARLRSAITAHPLRRWQDAFTAVALPLLR